MSMTSTIPRISRISTERAGLRHPQPVGHQLARTDRSAALRGLRRLVRSMVGTPRSNGTPRCALDGMGGRLGRENWRLVAAGVGSGTPGRRPGSPLGLGPPDRRQLRIVTAHQRSPLKFHRASVQPAGHRPAVALEVIPELRSQGILLDADLRAVDRQDKCSHRQHRNGRPPQDRIRNQQAGHSDVHGIPRQPVRTPDDERPGRCDINRINARALSTELLNAPCEKPSGSQRDNRGRDSGSRPHRTVASDEMLTGRQTRTQQCRGNTELVHFFLFLPDDNPLRNPTISR